MQKKRNPSALTVELRLFCIKPSICRGWGGWSYGTSHVAYKTIHNNICKIYDQLMTLYDTEPFCT